MPTESEKEAQRQRNKQIAQSVASGVATKPLGTPDKPGVQELSPAEARQKWEGYQYELSDEEAAGRMQQEQPSFEGIVRRMAENYQTSPQYQQLLDQELEQISAQIAELTQRRNMIMMAKQGTG
jgi:hypothetical protein